MENNNRLIQWIKKAKYSLAIEHYFKMLQGALFYGFLSVAIIFLISRLFVLPYYTIYAWSLASLVFVIFLGWAFWKRPKEDLALRQLDAYFPDNVLLTAVSFMNNKAPLAQGILRKAEVSGGAAFEAFKKRKKHYFEAKWVVGFVISFAAILLLYTFPATTQLEAKDIEQEKQIISDIKKEVEKLEKKELSKAVKKDLEELRESLKDTELAEEALRELIKKQKELALKEQKLEEKKDMANSDGSEGSALNEDELKELASLKESNSALAKSSASAHSTLSKMGKKLPFSANNIAQGTTNSNNNSNSNQQNQGQQNQGQQGQGQGQSQGQGQGQSQGQGQGQSQGQGQGQSQGQGQGQSQGQGQGQGQGSGGQGAGKGSGGRDLLSIPSRIGGTGDTSVDSGSLGEGESASEEPAEAPTTRGTVKSYEEVINEYSDSYLKSSERMQLPSDLQRIVQDYFSSVENNND